MAACGLAGGDQDEAAARDALDLALGDAELGWVDEVVGGVDVDQPCADALELGRGVVVARRVDLVEQIVRVERGQLGPSTPAR